MAACFVLLTDFGLADPYVGQLKAVLHRLAPGCNCIDLSHGVPPFRVETGAMFLAASVPYIPHHAICLAVVDPGVGSQRCILCLRLGQRTFIAPDNGLLSIVAARHGGEDARVWQLRPEAMSDGPSPTFHARDIMAPAAAKLASGTPPDALGVEISPDHMTAPGWALPVISAAGLEAHVLHTDHFGNCILNIQSSIGIEARVLRHKGSLWALQTVDHYAAIPDGHIGFLRGSQGFWELAANRGSAANLLDLHTGDMVTLSGTLQ